MYQSINLVLLSDLLGVSTSKDVDVVETELNAYTRVPEVPLDTDPHYDFHFLRGSSTVWVS